jgi:hypothetical protein
MTEIARISRFGSDFGHSRRARDFTSDTPAADPAMAD